MSELTSRIEALEQDIQSRQTALSEQFEALAKLTAELEAQREQLVAQEQSLHELRQAQVEAAQQAEALQDEATPAPAAEEEVSDGLASSPLQHADLVRDSELFDADWYLARYPDVKADAHLAEAPHEHYLLFGGFEGRNPCPEFESTYYLEIYPDVAEAGMNPLVHYLLHGRSEGRRIHPPFEGEA
ncbi:hypothetical protein [Halomonas lysinitropha]|uniref:hypothetical protein n=1 Tax=Halomonas lysinitropha TaxID=2607506 RepID=UPI00124A6100|nr:hypothetical protein [Halomonas lysinitropha]